MECRLVIVLIALCLVLPSGAQTISECVNGRVDIVENQTNTITCQGDFETHDTLKWNIEKNGVERNVGSCSCTPQKQCKAEDEIKGTERMCGDKVFQLFIVGTPSLHGKKLICERVYQQGQLRTKTNCILNVRANEITTHSRGTVEAHSPSPTQYSPQHGDPSEVPLGPIVGGAVAAIVVIIVVVIIVVIVFVKRRRTKNNTGAGHSSQQNVYYEAENGTEVNVVNSQYAEGNAYNGSPELGIYASADDDDPLAVPNSTQETAEGGFGTYDAPRADVYAQVDKSKQKKNKQASSGNSSIPHTTAGNDEYAVVNKASKAKTANPSDGYFEGNNPSVVPPTDVYAQVDKTAKKSKTFVSAPKTPPEEAKKK